MKTALITGINGTDGSHLSELLIKKGYKVYGLERRSSSIHRENLCNIRDKINFLSGDLTDQSSLLRALKTSQPDEVYNLAAQSFVKASFDIPEQTSDVTGIGVLRMLEAIREYNKPIKFYQACSSEMFGKVQETPQTETTPFYPRSPYGIAKLYGHWITKNYRESYNMFNVNGILFNHESPRRGTNFVTNKVVKEAVKIKLGLTTELKLGNLNASRDWGHAKDYVKAMWLMLQQDKPKDYVISTGIKYSIKDFLTMAFKVIDINNWDKYIIQDERYMRPAEVDMLVGDSSKAHKELGWKPKTSIQEMVSLMVNNDIKLLKKQYEL